MTPIRFAEANRQLNAPAGMEENVEPLHVWTDGQLCVSCWRPTWRERLSILFSGRVWLAVLAHGGTQPPVSLAGQNKYFESSV